MAYVLVGVLLVASVAVLTLPWPRRDPADFTPLELGYAWRGSSGAVRAALGVLHDLGLVRARRGRVERRDKKKLPRGTDPFVRAVFDALGPTADSVSSLLENPSVQEHLTPVADRAIGTRLRVGAPRRAAGLVLVFASPVIVLVALAHGEGPVVAGVLTGLAAVVVGGRLLGLHGMTIAGARTLAMVPGRRSRLGKGKRAGLADMSAGSGPVFGETAFETPGGYGDGSY